MYYANLYGCDINTRWAKEYLLNRSFWKRGALFQTIVRHTFDNQPTKLTTTMTAKGEEGNYYTLTHRLAMHCMVTLPRLRRFKTRVMERYRKNLHTETIIARNRKDGYPDQEYPIRFHIRDDFWMTAFYGHMKGGMENNKFVVFVNREQTTQAAVKIFSDFTMDSASGKRSVYEHIDGHTSVEDLQLRLDHLLILGDKWYNPHFTACVMGYLQDYIDRTLYRLKNTTSFQRLSLFVNEQPILATYIWKANFSKPEQRAALAEVLKIARKRQNAFIRSQSIEDLKQWTVKVVSSSRSQYDDLPPHLQQRIKTAEAALQQARRGSRVGFTGWYISSDAIQAAETRVQDAWREADKWLGHQRLKATRLLPV